MSWKRHSGIIALICVAFPLLSQNIVYPDDARVVDITKAPYNADKTGSSDVTDVIQQAVDDHRTGTRIIYFPNGRYKVSDQIYWGETAWNQGPAFEGQQKDSVVIQLTDNNPKYQDKVNTRAVIWTGDGSADNFRNEIRNLTINVGSGNPGACGIKFNSNNMGTVFNVDIISEDGQGAVGLDMAYTDMIGPLLINDVYVRGFDIGVKTGGGVVNSMTMESVTVENQNVAGYQNGGQVVSIRDLHSINTVQAVKINGGDVTLVDSYLENPADYSDIPAVFNKGRCFIRNVHTPGYAFAFENTVGNKRNALGEFIVERASHEVLSLFPGSGLSLNLPVKEIPEVSWEQDMGNWKNVMDFGAVPDDGLDDSDAFQQAINAGGTTVYAPNGKYRLDDTITISGNVSRIISTSAIIEGDGGFELVEGEAPVVIIERFRRTSPTTRFVIIHNSTRTLHVRNFSCRVVGKGTGDFFLSDVVGGPHEFINPDQHIWCRQLDTEQGGSSKGGDFVNITNNGSNLWVLGYKTENANIKIKTINGGSTEVLGHFCYAVGSEKLDPVYHIENASVSVAGMRHTSFGSTPYNELVREIRGTDTLVLNREEAVHGNAMPLFDGHSVNIPVPSAWYALNENAGKAVIDSAANEYHGEFFGSEHPGWEADSGVFEGSLRFDGIDDYVVLSDDPGIRPFFHDTITRQSLSIWFFPEETFKEQVLFTRGSNENGWGLKIRSSKVTAVFRQGGELQTVSARVDANVWQHVAVTIDYGYCQLFVNGLPVDELTLNDAVILPDSSASLLGAWMGTNPFRSGSEGETGGFYNGMMDEVRLYNNVLSSSFIDRLSWFIPKPISQVYFSMDEINGDTLFESFSSGFTATLNGLNFEGEGITGNGLSMNGWFNWVELEPKNLGTDPDPFFQLPYESRSVSVWINANETSSSGMIYSQGRHNGMAIRVIHDSLTAVVNRTELDVTRSVKVGTPYSTMGEWKHVVLVFDNGDLKLYINAELADSSRADFTGVLQDLESVELGCQADVGPFFTGTWEQQYEFFNGLLDEFRIYNRALTLPDILELYNITSSDLEFADLGKGIAVMPNPSGGKIRISLPARHSAEQIRIYSVSGELVAQMPVTRHETEVELTLEYLPEGLYVVVVQEKEMIRTEKILLQ